VTARRGILSALVAVLAIALTACSGLPTSGKVNYGLSTSDAPDAEDVSFLLPDSPLPGATPEQIVEGFIRAGSGPGAAANWDRAREFLTPEFSKAWKPGAGVTVDVFEDRTAIETEEGVVSMSVTSVATVDDTGAYERAEVGRRLDLPFELTQVDGEWRISFALDGIVLDRDEFPRVFHNYSLMFFDPTWNYLVPDARWYPTTAAPRLIALALNDPPSAWLDGAVFSAFPEGVEVVASVPQAGNAYEVDLSEAVLSVDLETRNRIYTQLRTSLATAGVTDVELTVQSTPIDAEPVPVRSTRVPGAPLVLVEEGFGFLAGDELEPIPGLSDIVAEFAPVAIQVGPEREEAAVRQTDGAVSILRVDETFDVLDARPGLVDPALDPFGIVWTVPRDRPGGVQAYLPDLTPVIVADAWPGASAIHAMAISRDGSRMAAVVTAGGRTTVSVAGVIRGPDQVPQRLGDPVELATVPGDSRGIAWLDDLSIGVLSGDGEGTSVLEQVVGGMSTTSSASADMTSIAGGTSLSSVRLLAEDGTLSVKRGTSWQPAASGILVLATQQGMPG
jgi:hypothetical protein